MIEINIINFPNKTPFDKLRANGQINLHFSNDNRLPPLQGEGRGGEGWGGDGVFLPYLTHPHPNPSP
jgi:hypothetical protein